MVDWTKCPGIERVPDRHGGDWVFAGSRLPVYSLLENLAGGATIQQYMDWFHPVDEWKIQAVLQHLTDALKADAMPEGQDQGSNAEGFKEHLLAFPDVPGFELPPRPLEEPGPAETIESIRARLAHLPEPTLEDFREVRITVIKELPEEEQRTGRWRPKRTFANADVRAVTLARLLHETRKPALTILFGSRARGDYAEGRSDIDLLLVEDTMPDEETARQSWQRFKELKAELYRGQRIDADTTIRKTEDLLKRSRAINLLESAALYDGYIIGAGAEWYGALTRQRQANFEIKGSRRHLDFLKGRTGSDDEDQGIQAFLAVLGSLKAAINAAGEWCPDLNDVGMLLDLANRADPEGRYSTTLDSEIYTQYGGSWRGIEPERPFTDRHDSHAVAITDAEGILARAEELKKGWPAPHRHPGQG